MFTTAEATVAAPVSGLASLQTTRSRLRAVARRWVSHGCRAERTVLRVCWLPSCSMLWMSPALVTGGGACPGPAQRRGRGPATGQARRFSGSAADRRWMLTSASSRDWRYAGLCGAATPMAGGARLATAACSWCSPPRSSASAGRPAARGGTSRPGRRRTRRSARTACARARPRGRRPPGPARRRPAPGQLHGRAVSAAPMTQGAGLAVKPFREATALPAALG